MPVHSSNVPFSLVSVIVPAYNEVRSIKATLDDVFNYFNGKPYACEVIVSADGDDGTRELVRDLSKHRPRLSVIGSSERNGKGHGVREGVHLAQGDIVGFVDADGKTPFEEFDRFAAHFAAGADIVIGSRAMRESRIERPQPFYRRIGSRGFALCMHALVGLGSIRDTQCGFKFFRRAAAVRLFRSQRIDGYMFDVEILYVATRLGFRIVQEPVRWRDDGDSRLQLFSGNLQNAVDLFRIRFGPTIR